MEFKDFNLDPRILEGLDSIGFKNPTPIQQETIPVIIEGKDLIACAQTGTGKTAAYLLPLLHKIIQNEDRQINTLILAPTRELAQQIDLQIEGLSYFTSVSSVPIFGGGDGFAWDQQKKALIEGSDIITATPGRLISFLTSSEYNFKNLQHLVLDEADRMLDMGFFDDIIRITKYLPERVQTLLFSATMPPKIRMLANKILKDPHQVNIAISKPAEGILQQAYLVYDTQKVELVQKILNDESFQSVIIFASTKDKVKLLDSSLRKAGLQCKAFHSDLEQNEREQILRDFKGRRIRILVGTDVISRGIDVEGINLVINYDSPSDPEDYIHRIGRTARASSQGTAITFINNFDQQKFFRIESLIGAEIPKLPLPVGFEPGPAYEPEKAPSEGNRNRSFNKRKKNWKNNISGRK
jgi:ATP-dependent RNA helicase RhlE